jgi:hypothetical protein
MGPIEVMGPIPTHLIIFANVSVDYIRINDPWIRGCIRGEIGLHLCHG